MNQSERQINNQNQKMKNYVGFPIKIQFDFLHTDVCVNLGTRKCLLKCV